SDRSTGKSSEGGADAGDDAEHGLNGDVGFPVGEARREGPGDAGAAVHVDEGPNALAEALDARRLEGPADVRRGLERVGDVGPADARPDARPEADAGVAPEHGGDAEVEV
ncbi:MAG: hypothetical protein ACK559_03665, partial [bacterium]